MVKKKIKEKEVKEEVKKEVVVSGKEKLKELFLKLLESQVGKFNKNEFLDNASKGKLRDAMDEHDDHARKLFDEILNELVEDKKLFHVGGNQYSPIKKGK